MPSAIKGAGVAIVVIADWRPLGEVAAIAVEVAILVQHVAVDGDVRRQHRVGSRLTTIDLPSKLLQICCRTDLIRSLLSAPPFHCPRCRWMRQQHGAAEQGQDEQALNKSSFHHHCFLLLCHRVSSLPFATGQGLPLSQAPQWARRGRQRRGAAGAGGALWDGWPQVPSRAPGSWR